MISVQEAEQLILEHSLQFPQVKCPLALSPAKILQENIYAERDAPPFHRVTMDGVALSLAAWEQGRRQFSIEGVQKAGDPAMTLKDPLKVLEVMTGAPLPKGCEGVIPYEELLIKDSVCTVINKSFPFEKMLNIHQQGSDHRKGDLVLSQGALIRSPHLGVAASSGKKDLLVSESPAIAIISTGDELVDFEQTPLEYQVRRSNPWALQGELTAQGFHQIELFHLRDNESEMLMTLQELMKRFPILIISGGVSKGKFDYIPQVLSDLQVQKIFHEVRQRPGKPFWFGVNKQSGKTSHMVFGLPGNPCSCLMTLRRYIVPLFCAKVGKSDMGNKEQVMLAEDFPFAKKLTFFLPVRLQRDGRGKWAAYPQRTHGSGDYGSLAESDGFIELPEERELFLKGEFFDYYPWGGGEIR